MSLQCVSPTYYNACTHSRNKPSEAMLALHTPQPTAHTECLWEHLWCERWRTNSSGWVWFSSPRAPFPSHRQTHTGLARSLILSPSLCSSVIFSRTMNIPPTLAIWGSYRSWITSCISSFRRLIERWLEEGGCLFHESQLEGSLRQHKKHW